MQQTDYARAEPGTELPPIAFGPITRQMLALYAGASGDHNPVHIDIDFARQAGLPDVFAHGMLSMGVLARVVTDWAGAGRLVTLSSRFLAITPVGADLTCSGTVSEQFEQEGVPHLRIAILAEITTPDGQNLKTLVGEAVVRAGDDP